MAPGRGLHHSAIAVVALGLVACVGEISGGPLDGEGPRAAGAGGSSSIPGQSEQISPETGLPAECENAEVKAAEAPVARLTNQEYEHSVRDLFPGLTLPALTLPAEPRDDGFDNVTTTQAPSATWIEAYSDQATAIGDAAAAELSTLLPCAGQGDDESCGANYLALLAERAFRRPLDMAESSRLRALFDTSYSSWGLAQAISLSIRALLQSPAYLYRIELGEAATAGDTTTALTAHELASRLSYFLWDTLPDSELLSAAASGALTGDEALETQARRMLAEPRARQAIAVFSAQWLRFEKMQSLAKSSELFPSFNEQTAAALRESTERFVERAFWEEKTLGSLLTSSKVFANASTAAIYGVATTSAELELLDAPAGQRAGILSQAGLLAGFAHETSDSPVLRGVFVLDRLLCAEPEPPPPGVPPAPADDPSEGPKTTRERFEEHLTSPVCAGCHETIDGIGFGFSNFDAVGAYRSQEHGLDVDASGSIRGTLDADGAFTGVVELGARLAESRQVEACVARYLYRYAFGLTDEQVEACSLLPAVKRFQASGGSLPELVVGLVMSAPFRRRNAVQP